MENSYQASDKKERINRNKYKKIGNCQFVGLEMEGKMATSKDFIIYLTEQVNRPEDIAVEPMMGEYLLYYRGKLVGDICDNRVLLKPVEAAKKLLPNAEMQPPYTGAKPMLVLEDIDDAEFVLSLFEAMYPELPEPKAKKVKK